MKLLAHRGHHTNLPENTLAAFESAAALGFHGIETDVRYSADQQLVLLHDRITPAGIPVSALTRQEIEAVLGHPVATLQEALEALPNLLWNIEIKELAAVPDTIKVLAHYQRQRQLLVSSFRHDIAVECAQQLDIPCGLLVAHRSIALNSLLHGALPYPRLRHIVWCFEFIDPLHLAMANTLGFRNLTYGVETREDHDLCPTYGLHGVITDHPEHVGLGLAHHTSLH